jgi:hypothetical protein
LPGSAEVRYSDGSLVRARAAADVAADAYSCFTRLFAVEPDIAVIVASEGDWDSRQPYGLPFFNDGEAGLARFWDCFHAADPLGPGEVTRSSLARLLTTEVSQVLGRATQNWR